MDVTKFSGSFPFRHDLERLIRDSIAGALHKAIISAFSASSATDPPEQPMNNDYDDLQPSCSYTIDSTYASLSLKEESSHPVTPPRRSSWTDCHAPERLGYSPRKFGFYTNLLERGNVRRDSCIE
ncbi:hypothetical protein KY290_015029 [Solanum tuberosum]|uniref:Uncharacterized protein n=1 Tax=Solanum tuberosum TaxID=4113 RepID=A0ABQ7VRH7_SOLTU|nr:hypothetical protein KY290_015029 [Solanum tuberosum]